MCAVVLRYALLCSFFIGLGVGVPDSVAQRPESAAPRAAYERLLAGARARGTVPVLVTLTDRSGTEKAGLAANPTAFQEYALHTLAEAGYRASRTYRHVPVARFEVDAAQLERLARSPVVASVEEDVPYAPLLDQSVPVIGADRAWEMGGSGAGQVVVVIDTGVDAQHPFLAGKVIAEACFSTRYESATSDFASLSLCPDGADMQTGAGAGAQCEAGLVGCDHGTRVAGIAAGRGEDFSGVARDADLVAIQVFSRFENYCGPDPCVRSWVSDQIAALEHVYDLSETLPIAAVNLSLGGGHYTSEESCDALNPALKSAIDLLWARGIAVVAAAGNSGQSDGLVAPACLSTSVSVGATTLDDGVSSFSSSATFLDLLAPGVSITSSVPGGGYGSGDGTSFAAPHVAGAWAILKSRRPDAAIEEVLGSLAETGIPVLDSRNEVTTARVRVDLALESTLLPVELVAFDSRVSDRGVELVWETEAEINNAGFEIQRGDDGRFVPIGFVEGAGTYAGRRHYTYLLDSVPPGRHRFRLKQIDFDGFSSLSPEIDVLVPLDRPYRLGAAYPNPFNPRTHFYLTLAAPQRVRVSVYNTLGQEVAVLGDEYLEAEHAYRYTFDASGLANGLYLIHARGETFSVSEMTMLVK